MIVLDTNIFIYLVNGTLDKTVIRAHDISHASVIKIEALGFSEISAKELLLLNELFRESLEIPLNGNIVKKSIKLKQAKKMSLGDAIVAATALENDCPLWTANLKDFQHISELKLVNPLSK